MRAMVANNTPQAGSYLRTRASPDCAQMRSGRNQRLAIAIAYLLPAPLGQLAVYAERSSPVVASILRGVIANSCLI